MLNDADAIMNAEDPIAACLAAGATVKKSTETSSSSLNLSGVEFGASEAYTVTHTWTLPGKTGVRASFGKESLKHTFIKLFKSEIQVGDPSFDDAVYISTATEAATKRLLASGQFQNGVLGFVATGGDVAVQDDTVTLRTRSADEHVEPDTMDSVSVLAALLALVE